MSKSMQTQMAGLQKHPEVVADHKVQTVATGTNV